MAKPSSGCVFGGSCNGSRNEEAITSGIKAGNELVNSLDVVDDHMQDHASTSTVLTLFFLILNS